MGTRPRSKSRRRHAPRVGQLYAWDQSRINSLIKLRLTHPEHPRSFANLKESLHITIMHPQLTIVSHFIGESIKNSRNI